MAGSFKALHTRVNVRLNNVIPSGIAIPISTCGSECIVIAGDLRFTLEQLHVEARRGMPGNMTVHQPSLCSRYSQFWITKIYWQANWKLTPGLSVLMAITMYPVDGNMAESLRGAFTSVKFLA